MPEGKKPRRPKDNEAKQRLSRLKEARNTRANNMGLEPSFLVSGSVLERIAREPPPDKSSMVEISGLTTWRSALLDADLWSAL